MYPDIWLLISVKRKKKKLPVINNKPSAFESEIKKQLSNVQTLHFDDYVFEGEVDNFYQWVLDVAFFIDTPLDNKICKNCICPNAKRYITIFRIGIFM